MKQEGRYEIEGGALLGKNVTEGISENAILV